MSGTCWFRSLATAIGQWVRVGSSWELCWANGQCLGHGVTFGCSWCYGLCPLPLRSAWLFICLLRFYDLSVMFVLCFGLLLLFVFFFIEFPFNPLTSGEIQSRICSAFFFHFPHLTLCHCCCWPWTKQPVWVANKSGKIAFRRCIKCTQIFKQIGACPLI